MHSLEYKIPGREYKGLSGEREERWGTDKEEGMGRSRKRPARYPRGGEARLLASGADRTPVSMLESPLLVCFHEHFRRPGRGQRPKIKFPTACGRRETTNVTPVPASS